MKRTRWLFLVAILALVVAACGGDTADEDTTTTTAAPSDDGTTTTTAAPTTTTSEAMDDGGDEPVTVIVGTTDSISVIDPADAYAVHGWEIIRNTGVGLLAFERGTTNLVPGIADFPEISDDGLTYTFTLRDGVTFGDGTPLTAQDYAAHIERMLALADSGTEGVATALATPFIASVEATDDKTVVFTLNGPFATFPQVVTSASYMPVHPDLLAVNEVVAQPEPPFYGVGAWILEDYTVGEQAVFVPNPYYFGDAPNVDRIIIRYFEQAPQLVLALTAGEIDIAWRSVTEPGLLDELANTDGIVSAVVPGGGIRYALINHALPPTDDINVRKALAAAIDRDEIVDRAFGGNAETLFSPIPPGFLGADDTVFDDTYAAPDLDAARAFLAESGYTEDNPLQLDINYPPNRYGGVVQDAMQVVADQWEATGAIEVELVGTEWATFLGEALGGESYAVSFLGWFFDYPDSSNYIDIFVEYGGLGTSVTDADNNPSPNLTRPELVDLVNEARTTTDQAERAALYEQIQEAWADDVVTLPLWFEPERVFYWDYVSGDASAANAESLNIGPTTLFDYSAISIDR